MDAAELEWIAWTTPITTSLGAALAASNFSGRTVACRQHSRRSRLRPDRVPPGTQSTLVVTETYSPATSGRTLARLLLWLEGDREGDNATALVPISI